MAALAAAPRAAAIGGVLELGSGGDPADWALGFLRYSAYLPPGRPGPTAEVAADNAVYRRDALEQYPETWRDGFWETTVHAQFRQHGLAILLDPRMLVTHHRSLSPLAFSRQRFAHGRAFGAERFGRAPAAVRMLRAAAAPIAGAVLAGRVGARVFARRRHRLRLLASLPVIGWFVACWIAGETTGYFLGPPRAAQAQIS
jgi:hypothetical protein